MTLRCRITRLALTNLMRLAWESIGAARRLEAAGERLEHWVDGTAATCGIDVLDVLAPLTERHSGAREA